MDNDIRVIQLKANGISFYVTDTTVYSEIEFLERLAEPHEERYLLGYMSDYDVGEAYPDATWRDVADILDLLINEDFFTVSAEPDKLWNKIQKKRKGHFEDLWSYLAK